LSFYFLTFCFVFTVSLPVVGRGYVLLPLVLAKLLTKKLYRWFLLEFRSEKNVCQRTVDLFLEMSTMLNFTWLLSTSQMEKDDKGSTMIRMGVSG